MILFFKFPLIDSLGGAEEHTLKLAKHFQKAGRDVRLFTSDRELLELFQNNNLPAEYVWAGWEPTSKWSLLLWPVTYFIARGKLKNILLQFQTIEAVFMQSLTEKLILAPLLQTTNYKLQTKTVWLEHKIPGRWLKMNPLKFRYLKLSEQIRIVTVSSFAKQEFVKLGINENNIKVIYPGVRVLNSKLLTHNSNFTIGILSRLHPEKGVFDFLKNITPTLKKHPNWQVLIAGEGKEKFLISNYLISKKLDNQVKLLGFISDKANFFSQISVLCYPSRAPESFGLGVIEAQSRGVPVIASNIGALPEILNHFNLSLSPGGRGRQGEGGYIVNNPKEWVKYLEALTSPAIYKKMSVSSQENAQNFSEAKMFEEFEKLV